jgi:origin recognition complex subunit 5
LRTSVDECKDRSSSGKASNIRYFGSRDGLLTELEFHVSMSAKY